MCRHFRRTFHTVNRTSKGEVYSSGLVLCIRLLRVSPLPHSSSSLFTTTRVLTSTDRHAVSSCCPSPADLGAAEAYFYRAVHAGDLRRLTPARSLSCTWRKHRLFLWSDILMMLLCVDVIMQRDRHTSCGGGISQRGQLHLCVQPCPLLLLKFRQKTSRFDAHDIFIYNCLYHHHVECPDLLCRLLCCAGQNLHFCFVLDVYSQFRDLWASARVYC